MHLCSRVRQNILCAAGGVWLGGHKMQIPDVVKSLYVKITTWIRIATHLEYRLCNFV